MPPASQSKTNMGAMAGLQVYEPLGVLRRLQHSWLYPCRGNVWALRMHSSLSLGASLGTFQLKQPCLRPYFPLLLPLLLLVLSQSLCLLYSLPFAVYSKKEMDMSNSSHSIQIALGFIMFYLNYARHLVTLSATKPLYSGVSFKLAPVHSESDTNYEIKVLV